MKARALAALGLLALGAGGGCLSMSGQTTLDAMQGDTVAQPVVEAYIEFAGPAERWVGPTSFILHVVAKDSGMAQIAVRPALFNKREASPAEQKDRAAGRVLASKGMSGDSARENLATLASALQGAESPFKGCLLPVRVRLIRADGSLVEKQGCRGAIGWPQVASEMVNTFVTAALYGVAPAQPPQGSEPKPLEPKPEELAPKATAPAPAAAVAPAQAAATVAAPATEVRAPAGKSAP